MNQTSSGEDERTVVGVVGIEDRTQAAGQPQGEPTQLVASVDCPVCHTPNPPSETYCVDCGFLLSGEPVDAAVAAADVGRLVTCDGSQEFALRPGRNSVGRENADVLLTQNTVSRSHALIVAQEGGVTIEDLGSTNGTYVDGRRLSQGETVELTDGCEITVGNVSLRFHAPEAAAEDAQRMDVSEPWAAVEEPEAGSEEQADGTSAFEQQEESAADVEQRPPVVARLVSIDGAARFDVVEGLNTIGRRSGENTIVITDPYASGRHADIMAEAGVLVIADVGSTNGTLVNGVRLEPNSPRQVRPGDEITIGQSVFRLEEA